MESILYFAATLENFVSTWGNGQDGARETVWWKSTSELYTKRSNGIWSVCCRKKDGVKEMNKRIIYQTL